MTSESGAGGSGGAVGGGGAEAEAHAGGRDHALGTRPLVLPETFDGNDWYFHYENVATVKCRLTGG